MTRRREPRSGTLYLSRVSSLREIIRGTFCKRPPLIEVVFNTFTYWTQEDTGSPLYLTV